MRITGLRNMSRTSNREQTAAGWSPRTRVQHWWRGRAARLAATTFALAATISSAGIAASSPASAATYLPVTACFKTYPLVSPGAWGAYNRNVDVVAWVDGVGAYRVFSTTPGLNGCLTVQLPPGYYWRLEANATVLSTHYSKATPWLYLGNTGYNFGAVYIYPWGG